MRVLCSRSLRKRGRNYGAIRVTDIIDLSLKPYHWNTESVCVRWARRRARRWRTSSAARFTRRRPRSDNSWMTRSTRWWGRSAPRIVPAPRARASTAVGGDYARYSPSYFDGSSDTPSIIRPKTKKKEEWRGKGKNSPRSQRSKILTELGFFAVRKLQSPQELLSETDDSFNVSHCLIVDPGTYLLEKRRNCQTQTGKRMHICTFVLGSKNTGSLGSIDRSRSSAAQYRRP